MSIDCEKFGHVDRSDIGTASEAITPLLAKGLQLPVTSGVIIVDVRPGGPAESAGLKIGDIVLAIDDKEMSSLPQLASSLYLHPTDEPMKVKVLRGTDKLTFHVPVFAQKHDVDRLVDLVDPEKNLVVRSGFWRSIWMIACWVFCRICESSREWLWLRTAPTAVPLMLACGPEM